MKTVLLVGLGRFGRHCAIRLHELGHQIMAVDINERRVQEITPYVTNVLIGDCTRADFVQSLGVSDYDLCFVAIGDNFQSSLEATSLLKEMGAKKVISRASRDVHAKFLLRNGADQVVYPEKQVAEWSADRYSSDLMLDYFSMGEDYAVMEIRMPASWIGRTISELDIRKKYQINILAVRRNGRLNMQILPDMVLNGDETLLVLGKEQHVQKSLER